MNSSPEPTSPARYSAENQHDEYCLEDWKTAVIKNETDLGYHEWAATNLEMDEQDAQDEEEEQDEEEQDESARAVSLRQELAALNTASAVAARGWMV